MRGFKRALADGTTAAAVPDGDGVILLPDTDDDDDARSIKIKLTEEGLTHKVLLFSSSSMVKGPDEALQQDLYILGARDLPRSRLGAHSTQVRAPYSHSREHHMLYYKAFGNERWCDNFSAKRIVL